MLHIDISPAGLDPMAEMTDEEFDAAQDRYIDLVCEALPDWASCEWSDGCNMNISTDYDHEDDDLREILDDVWEKFCQEA